VCRGDSVGEGTGEYQPGIIPNASHAAGAIEEALLVNRLLRRLSQKWTRPSVGTQVLVPPNLYIPTYTCT